MLRIMSYNAYGKNSKNFNHKVFQTLFLCIFFSFSFFGCSSYRLPSDIEPARFSKKKSSWFSQCTPSEGGGHLFFDDNKSPEIRFDWLAEDHEKYIIQLSDPLGRLQQEITWDSNTFTFSFHKRTLRHPSLFVDQEGYIFVEDNLTGIKVTELICILNGKLPETWKSLFYKIYNDKDTYIMFRGNVKIQTTFNTVQEKYEESCTDITIKHFWGLFTSKVSWCASPKLNYINFDDKFSIKWKLENE